MTASNCYFRPVHKTRSRFDPEEVGDNSYFCRHSIGRGYRAVGHGGGLFGHTSRLELFPDISLGVYSSVNGVEANPSVMELIGLYVGT